MTRRRELAKLREELDVERRALDMMEQGRDSWREQYEKLANAKRYTLSEAQQALEEQRCARQGHQYRHVETSATNDPVRLYCARCVRSWDITPKETP